MLIFKSHLQKVIDHKNFWAKYLGGEVMDVNTLTQEQANELYEHIDAGMSPENLHCDGECSPKQVRAKSASYASAVKELKKRGFAVPSTCYEIG